MSISRIAWVLKAMGGSLDGQYVEQGYSDYTKNIHEAHMFDTFEFARDEVDRNGDPLDCDHEQPVKVEITIREVDAR